MVWCDMRGVSRVGGSQRRDRYHSVVFRLPRASRVRAAGLRAARTVGVLAAVLLATAPDVSAQPAALEATLPLFPLRVRWTVDFGLPPTSGPASDGHAVFLPLESGALVAVDAETGAIRWQAADRPTRVPPVAADDAVYVVQSQALVALDLKTGAERWRTPFDAAVSAPLVARGGWVVVGLENGEVTALRGNDGVRVWTTSFATPVVAAPAINGARLYLPGGDARVRTVDIESGTLLWEQAVGGAVLTISPLGERVYVGADDNFFYALDDATGRRLWRWRTGGDPIGSASADDRRVYFSSLDTIVRALDRRHGAQQWRRPLPWRPRSGPLLAGSTVLVSGVALDLRGFAAATGTPVGEFALSADRLELLEGVPVLLPRARLPGALLIVALADGRLIALEHAYGLKVEPLTRLPGETMALTPPLPSAP